MVIVAERLAVLCRELGFAVCDLDDVVGFKVFGCAADPALGFALQLFVAEACAFGAGGLLGLTQALCWCCGSGLGSAVAASGVWVRPGAGCTAPGGSLFLGRGCLQMTVVIYTLCGSRGWCL